MRKIRLLLLVWTALASNNIIGQKIQKDYYPSGKILHEGMMQNDKSIGTHKYYFENGIKRSEALFGQDGLFLSNKTWDSFGNLLTIEEFKTKYLKYPLRDFSKTKWTKLDDGVWIYKFNTKDSVVQFTDSSVITANYICYFNAGQMLDNSYERETPVMFKLSYLNPGFRIGVASMVPGETALIKMLPDKAYGNKITGNVPANSTLIYQVELLKVE